MTYLDDRFALGSSGPVEQPPDDPWPDEPPPDEFSTTEVAEQRRPALSERLLSRSALRSLPEPSPLIVDTLDLGTVAVLAGYTQTFKSFIALGWACSIATATTWRHRNATRRRALYVAAEGASGLDGRVTAWEKSNDVDVHDDQLSVLPMAVHLGRHNEVGNLVDLVREGGYGFVIIDTLAKSMAGMDENSAQDMGRAVSNLYAIQEATNNGTVLVIHHTGKDKTTIRGSSALESGVDTVYATEGDKDMLRLSRTKRKDGPCEDVHTLAFHAVAGTNSGVILSVGGADIAPRAKDLLSVFMSAFSGTGASKAELRNAAEMPNATFARSLNALVEHGQLINHGTDQRPFYRLAG
ncbi:MAG TPA: AAA family ATPase [Pseudonocardiaceae bacterium]|nr:AAA family ATPase [Pseudonocardiaceae bacterium]